MAGGSSGGDDDLIAGINVTPLVDIVLVVLIIFMVTATDIVKAQIGVDLPKAASGQAEVKTTLTFKVKKDGTYLLDAKEMTLEQIAKHIGSVKKDDPDLRAVIAADKDVEYGKVIELIDTIKLNGIEKFALNIQRKLN
jgi:biopolymer transport protein ExbD